MNLAGFLLFEDICGQNHAKGKKETEADDKTVAVGLAERWWDTARGRATATCHDVRFRSCERSWLSFDIALSMQLCSRLGDFLALGGFKDGQ